jgi:hypothetical protein
MPAFTAPGAASTIAFVGVLLLVAALVLLGLRRVAPSWTGRAVFLLAAWIGLTGLLSSQLEVLGEPGPFVFFGVSNGAALLVALSPVGRRLTTLPAAALVGFHGFRLPLELVLHRWHAEHAIPVQMTWSGENLDVATGLLAVALGAWGWRRPLTPSAVWGFQAVGFGLLLNVMRVAARSTPGPLRAYPGEPLLLAWHLPYAWIVPLCVAGALAGHVVLLRRQLAQPPSGAAAPKRAG